MPLTSANDSALTLTASGVAVLYEAAVCKSANKVCPSDAGLPSSSDFVLGLTLSVTGLPSLTGATNDYLLCPYQQRL